MHTIAWSMLISCRAAIAPNEETIARYPPPDRQRAIFGTFISSEFPTEYRSLNSCLTYSLFLLTYSFSLSHISSCVVRICSALSDGWLFCCVLLSFRCGKLSLPRLTRCLLFSFLSLSSLLSLFSLFSLLSLSSLLPLLSSEELTPMLLLLLLLLSTLLVLLSIFRTFNFAVSRTLCVCFV